MYSRRIKSLNQNQSGLVAIVVTMVIMIILSLIVLGFARITRREQRQSLDRQLSTQAFYAAETGVNDATNALANSTVTETPSHLTDCDRFITDAGLTTKSQLSGADVAYTCLLVDQTPKDLEITNIALGKSEVMPIEEKNGNAFNSISIYWEDSGHGTDTECPAAGNFPAVWDTNIATPAICSTGILRVEFVPFSSARTRSQLTNERFVAFLHPVFGGGGGSVSYASGINLSGQGMVVPTTCTISVSDKDCGMRIDLPVGTVTKGYLRLTSVYRPATVTVCVPNCTAGVELKGAQASIDSTGRAVDVLRRIQVRVPILSPGDFPEFGVQSLQTLCKRMAVTPPSTISLQVPSGNWANGAETALCDPN